jgi:hypothetical protein
MVVTMNYNELSKEIYEQNKAVGWWDDPDRCKLTLLQLVSTEIAEATEAERKDLMDDHLLHRKGGEVELADAMIRLLDMAGAYGWLYIPEITSAQKEIMDRHDIAAKHYFLNCSLIGIGDEIANKAKSVNRSYSLMIDSIEYVSASQGYDLEGALREKLAYNAKRQDHKRETRAAEGGKKF